MGREGAALAAQGGQPLSWGMKLVIQRPALPFEVPEVARQPCGQGAYAYPT